mmetsp:Transcript_55039/g.154433  ORF Transcript_55039/g.154433 Transcript_55039/m.154433 type:complete len:87 (-) Transcript_55039:620-880(-)
MAHDTLRSANLGSKTPYGIVSNDFQSLRARELCGKHVVTYLHADTERSPSKMNENNKVKSFQEGHAGKVERKSIVMAHTKLRATNM